MNASRSLHTAAATLLTTVALVSAPMHAHAATETTTHHHHAKKGEAQTHKATGQAAAKKTKHTTHHAESGSTTTAAKHVKKKHAATEKGHVEHPAASKPHHAAHGVKHAPAAERPGVAPAPVPGDAGDQGAPDASTENTAPGQDPNKGSNTGLPLPRFAALRADEVNLRAGPGQRYPIQWVYHRRGLPVMIEREFDVWRLIEDTDGVKGWVHQATLVGSRDFVIPTPGGSTPAGASETAPAPSADKKTAEQPTGKHTESRIIGRVSTAADVTKIPGAVILHASGDDDSAAVAVLSPGTVGTIKACASGSSWCKVTVQHYDGWLQRSQIWGLSPDEAYPPS